MIGGLKRAGIDLTISAAVALAALAVAMLVVMMSGSSPTETLRVFFQGAFGDAGALGSTVERMVPLILVALAWIIVFSGGRFHVGFQGQLLIGGAFSAFIALRLDGLPSLILLPVAIVLGVCGGAAYAAIAAWLWAARGVNEILSTLLLNLVAIQVIAWLVRGPMQEPGKTLPQTDFFAPGASWPALPGQIFVHWDVVLMPVAITFVVLLLKRSPFGFRLRLVAANETAARYSAVSPRRVGVVAIILSGAFAGLAGSSLILAGETRAMADNFDAGYGFQGIAVALLARNSPVGCVASALLFAALAQGGGVVEATVGVSSAVVGLTQGLVIVFVLAAGGWQALERLRNGSRSINGTV